MIFSNLVRVDPIFSKESPIYFQMKKKVIYLNINKSRCVHFYIKNKIDIRDTIINYFFVILFTYKLNFYHFGVGLNISGSD